MALVNPNIAMSYRGVEIPNQMAQYAQMTQIQNAQQQNRLADMQMQEYARARTEEEGLRNYLAGADLAKPETRAGVMKFGKTGLAYGKALSEQETSAATLANVKSQTGERDFKLANDKLKHGWQSMGEAPTPQAAIEKLNLGVKSGYFTPEQAAAEAQKLAQITTPEQYKQYRVEKILGILDAKDQLAAMLPKVARQDIGGSIVNIQDNPALPGYGLPVADTGIVKTPTIGERTAQSQLKVSQGQLKVAQDRLAQEGQGVTYQTDEQNNLMALPSRLSAGVAPMARPVIGEGGVAIKGAPKSKDIAVSEQQAAYNIGRVLTAANEIKKIGEKDPRAIQPGAGEALAASVGMSGTANLARNQNRQIVRGAQRDALDALLYLATGAAYNKEQLEGQMEAYIPAYTDEAGTITAKKERMTALIKSAKTRAGKAWTPEMDASMKALTGPASAGTPAAAAGSNVVITPDGQSHTFPTPAAAAQFKKAAGL